MFNPNGGMRELGGFLVVWGLYAQNVSWGPLGGFLWLLLVVFLESVGPWSPKYKEDDNTCEIWLSGLWRVFWAQSPSDFLVSEPFGWPFISYWAESLNVCEAKKNF